MQLDRVPMGARLEPGTYVAAYSAQVSALAASATTELGVTIQASYNFVVTHITAQYNQPDWSFQVFLTGVGRNLFDRPMRGALFFGDNNTAASPAVWHHGWELPYPQLVTANSGITVPVTNGPTGALNLFIGFLGYAYK